MRGVLLAALAMAGPAPASSPLLARLDALPDLLEAARAAAPGDPYPEQERLAAEHRKARRPFKTSMPYRHPDRCPACSRSVPAVRIELVDPRPSPERRAELWERDVHAAREHGTPLPEAARALLERLE